MIGKGTILLVLMLPLGLQAQTTASTISPNDPVLDALDDLSMLPWLKNDPFTADTALLNIHHFAATDTPRYTPAVVSQRLAVLDQRTPFGITYNQPVQSYIDLYTVRKREQSSRMLGLAELYFPIFEEALDRHGLPMELKYLAVVESALNPAARSHASAVGLWQFMVGTGEMFGLEVDSYVDERCDVYQSTEAACLYLKQLYSIFGQWELALAAYNCGPGNVNKAVRRAGGKLDYWMVYDYLPRETRGYVPAFIAVNYLFAHAADHNIYPVVPMYCAYELDTVQVCYPLELNTLALACGGNAQELRDLNPMFKRGFVPDLQQPSTIYLPRTLVGDFIANEDLLSHSYLPTENTGGQLASASTPAKTTTTGNRTYTVRRGESLGRIAQKHGVSVAQLRAWNGLRNDKIRPGQKLVVKKGTATASTATENKPAQQATAATASPKQVEYIYHTVQPGDTLWDIARRYPGVTVEDIKRLNSGVGTNLTPGKKLKVGVHQG